MKAVRIALLLGVTLAASGGCAGGDDGGGDDDDDDGAGFALTSGTYLGMNSQRNAPGNTCAFEMTMDDVAVPVVVTGSTVTIDDISLTIDSSDDLSLSGGGIGLATIPDCTFDAVFSDQGAITGDDEMHLHEVITVSNPVGVDCPAATYPCDLDYDYDLWKP